MARNVPVPFRVPDASYAPANLVSGLANFKTPPQIFGSRKWGILYRRSCARARFCPLSHQKITANRLTISRGDEATQSYSNQMIAIDALGAVSSPNDLERIADYTRQYSLHGKCRARCRKFQRPSDVRRTTMTDGSLQDQINIG